MGVQMHWATCNSIRCHRSCREALNVTLTADIFLGFCRGNHWTWFPVLLEHRKHWSGILGQTAYYVLICAFLTMKEGCAQLMVPGSVFAMGG
jgi:hypothetical protein